MPLVTLGAVSYHLEMADSIGDLISGKKFQEPPEIGIIKDFVHSEIGVTPRVMIRSDAYIISLSSAAAAGSLRPNLNKLKNRLNTKMRLLIRIG